MIAVTIEVMSPTLSPGCIANLNQRDMAKQLLTHLRLIARMNLSLKNYSCELFNLTGTVGKVELISTFRPGFPLHDKCHDHDTKTKRL